jgi:hypothetical protein
MEKVAKNHFMEKVPKKHFVMEKARVPEECVGSRKSRNSSEST